MATRRDCPSGRIATTKRGERAQVLPLLAFCFAMPMGFGGRAVDAGYWDYWQRQQQNASDAAALGGAQQLARVNCPNQGAATSGATTDASANGFTATPGGNVTLSVQNPPAQALSPATLAPSTRDHYVERVVLLHAPFRPRSGRQRIDGSGRHREISQPRPELGELAERWGFDNGEPALRHRWSNAANLPDTVGIESGPEHLAAAVPGYPEPSTISGSCTRRVAIQ